MLTVAGIRKDYGTFSALSDFSLKVEDHALFGLMGPNGAGKTTLMRIIVGLLLPDSGSMEINGTDALKHPKEVKRMIGYVPDEFGTYDSLSVMEYMEFFAAGFGINGLKARKRCEELLSQVGLIDRKNNPVDILSRGMQQKLSIARALIHDPDFLVMDEPTNGLDPGTRHTVKEMLGELCVQGKTILISSHILTELSEVCTDIGIIESGHMKYTGSVSGILNVIENSNPLKISVLSGQETAKGIFRRNPCVRSISISGNSFLLNFDGSDEDEAVLLQQLIDAEIPVNGFMREPGNLESFFLQVTKPQEEKVILRNED
jgi:ABC-2 type transport system ATP-binding protein